jgi:P-type E1-E2 ATPase
VDLETSLTLIGLTGIEDPVRPEVPAAVAQCQSAGVRIIMVTGDNLDTAKSIAKSCNIYREDEGGIALEGKTLRA